VAGVEHADHMWLTVAMAAQWLGLARVKALVVGSGSDAVGGDPSGRDATRGSASWELSTRSSCSSCNGGSARVVVVHRPGFVAE
jgi:hypothetical protein